MSLIEENADLLLQETGMEFRDDPEILEIFREAGADVQGERVRFEPGMCRKLVQATAPRASSCSTPATRPTTCDRRRQHGALPVLGAALRARPGSGPALRDLRGLSATW